MRWRESEPDECGAVFGASVQHSGMVWPEDARVLEIGSAEYSWIRIARTHWPTLQLTGIDWRGGQDAPGASIVTGDVLVHEFPSQSFDVVVAISTIEHIGLGHYANKQKQGDPKDPNGDIKALGRAWRWLRPGGLLYFDVPWNAGESYGVIGTKFRVYDAAQHEARLKQSAAWDELWRGYYARHTSEPLTSVPTTALDASKKAFYHCACVWRKPLAS